MHWGLGGKGGREQARVHGFLLTSAECLREVVKLVTDTGGPQPPCLDTLVCGLQNAKRKNLCNTKGMKGRRNGAQLEVSISGHVFSLSLQSSAPGDPTVGRNKTEPSSFGWTRQDPGGGCSVRARGRLC